MPDVIWFFLYLLIGIVAAIARIIWAEACGPEPKPPGLVTIDEACWGAFYAVGWPVALPLDAAFAAAPWVARKARAGVARLFGGW